MTEQTNKIVFLYDQGQLTAPQEEALQPLDEKAIEAADSYDTRFASIKTKKPSLREDVTIKTLQAAECFVKGFASEEALLKAFRDNPDTILRTPDGRHHKLAGFEMIGGKKIAKLRPAVAYLDAPCIEAYRHQIAVTHQIKGTVYVPGFASLEELETKLASKSEGGAEHNIVIDNKACRIPSFSTDLEGNHTVGGYFSFSSDNIVAVDTTHENVSRDIYPLENSERATPYGTAKASMTAQSIKQLKDTFAAERQQINADRKQAGEEPLSEEQVLAQINAQREKAGEEPLIDEKVEYALPAEKDSTTVELVTPSDEALAYDVRAFAREASCNRSFLQTSRGDYWQCAGVYTRDDDPQLYMQATRPDEKMLNMGNLMKTLQVDSLAPREKIHASLVELAKLNNPDLPAIDDRFSFRI